MGGQAQLIETGENELGNALIQDALAVDHTVDSRDAVADRVEVNRRHLRDEGRLVFDRFVIEADDHIAKIAIRRS